MNKKISWKRLINLGYFDGVSHLVISRRSWSHMSQETREYLFYNCRPLTDEDGNELEI